LLLKAPEAEVAKRLLALEQEPLFERLVEAGVIAVTPFPAARFATRMVDFDLRAGGADIGSVLEGNDAVVQLIAGMGRERFQEIFLRDGPEMTDAQRALRCGISEAEERCVREFVDRFYIHAEFAAGQAPAVPGRACSCVGGVAMAHGRPTLSFFNRDIWKGRYHIDAQCREDVLGSLAADEFHRADCLLSELEFVDRRKSTLYGVLELILAAQAAYLATGDLADRHPLTQCSVALKLDVAPSVINDLVSNQSIELPWGVEVALKELLPSRKTVLRDQVYVLATQHPTLSDNALRGEIHRRRGVLLSRQSIWDYRNEIGARQGVLAREPKTESELTTVVS
jgi:hypothetical protein